MVLWARPRGEGRIRTEFAASPEEAVDQVASLLAAHPPLNLHFSLCLLGECPSTGRGRASDVAFVPGVWLELDVQGPAHEGPDYCPGIEEALALIDRFPLPASCVVHSGGGLHAYWAFDRLKEVRTPEERAEVRALVQGFQNRFRCPELNPLGYAVDHTDDLSRLLRVPGSLNLKYDPPARIRLLRGSGPGKGGGL